MIKLCVGFDLWDRGWLWIVSLCLVKLTRSLHLVAMIMLWAFKSRACDLNQKVHTWFFLQPLFLLGFTRLGLCFILFHIWFSHTPPFIFFKFNFLLFYLFWFLLIFIFFYYIFNSLDFLIFLSFWHFYFSYFYY